MPKVNGNACRAKCSSLVRTLTERNTALSRKALTEKIAKNEAYLFILQEGMLDAFALSRGYEPPNLNQEQTSLLTEACQKHITQSKQILSNL